MMRSLFSGVAGLRTHQTKMDVIGNNIANVNTTGYKSQSVTFRDLMYQTTQSASGANAETGTGGINARQIGLGVTTGAINTAIAQQGSAQTTNNPFDIMISGDNFFVVSNGSENFFTRDGSFYVDGAGNLAMTSTGYTVMGWQVDPETGEPKPDTVTALQIMNDSVKIYDPDGTSAGRVTGIVDRNDKNVHTTSGRIMNFEFYDNAGYLYTAKFSIHSKGTNGQYYIALDDIKDSTGASLGAEIINGVGFGDTMTVDTSIKYTLQQGKPVQKGQATFGYTLADGSAAQQSLRINENIDFATLNEDFLRIAYNIDKANAGITGAVQINENGTLSVVNGTEIFPLQNTVTMTPPAAGYTIDILDETGTVLKSLTPGTTVQYPGGADPSEQDLIDYYGLNVTEERVRSIRVETDGSITVTSKEVEKAANLEFNPGNGKFVGIGGNPQGLITLGLANADSQRFKDITLDFSTCSNVNNNGSSTVSAAKGTSTGLESGRPRGEMISISVDQSGIITAAYDNGMSRCLGQIATAIFANPSGLEKAGDNLYKASNNSGEFNGTGVDITASGGKMQSGVLEMSNVDLSQEFTEMITTQRGFQANSRIITVSDTLLEELTNLKR